MEQTSPSSTGFRYDFADLGPAHQLVISKVPPGSDVLELGCATGYMTRALAGAGCRVIVVDVDGPALQHARDVAVQALQLDLDREQLPPDLSVDVAVCADVLEHLKEPTTVLATLRQALRPGGRVVVSLPNIAFWRIRWQLARGRFEYEETGILDRTHLRFYTRAGVEAMVQSAGYRVVSVQGVPESFPGAWLLRTPLRPLKFKVDGALHRLFPRLFAYQWVLVLEVSGPQE